LKPLNQFLESLTEKSKTLEAEDLPLVMENNHEPHPNDPPPVLIMRRKAIRQYPDGQKVALYYVDKIDKYVTVPYNSLQLSATSEEVEPVDEGVLQNLKKISEARLTTSIVLENGDSVRINFKTANTLLAAYNNLTEENKKIMLEAVNKSKSDFNKVVEFATWSLQRK
jgi:hypothetical protein